MSASWLQTVRIATTAEAEEAVSEMLGVVCGQPASVHADFRRGTIRASVFLASGRRVTPGMLADLRAGLKAIRNAGLDAGPCRISIGRIRREDWAESWKRHFTPLEFGGKLLVQPTWSRRKARRGQAVIVLDPGLSFGTGQHATTSYCLREIVRLRRSGAPPSILDIGTGSGIVAIAAAALGYSPVHGFDFDPDAVRIARENARLNGVGRSVQIERGDAARLPRRGAKRFDVVVANLTADLLVAQSARILAQLDQDGTVILAGILGGQFGDVKCCYEAQGLKLVRTRQEREWRSGTFARGSR